jgi:prepilin-type N-terminal cleavage/methylation domain-containing protein
MKFDFLRKSSGSSVKGMTLVEVMISVGVFSIVMSGLVYVYLASAKQASANIAQLTIQSLARDGMDKIMDDLRRGDTASIFNVYPVGTQTSTNKGSYFRVLCPTNSVASSSELWRHFYTSNVTLTVSGATNASLYYYTSATSNAGPSSALGQPWEIVRGITNPDVLFEQVGGTVTVNIRVVDPNDSDGKQVIFLRSAVSFRNPGLY